MFVLGFLGEFYMILDRDTGDQQQLLDPGKVI